MTVDLEDAQARPPDLIARLIPGEELLIRERGTAIARLSRCEVRQWPCQPGSAKHLPIWMADDFDAPLDDLRLLLDTHTLLWFLADEGRLSASPARRLGLKPRGYSRRNRLKPVRARRCTE